jgi:flagellar biosynthesis/type III secretory pathway chaperone
MELREILKYQIETLEELDSLLDFERSILISDRAGELPGLLEKKRLIAQKLSLLERKRLELSKGKNAEQLSNEGLIASSQVEGLIEIVNRIKEKEETNLILTRQSINYIRMITSALNPAQRVVTYGNSGKARDNASAGLFTTKA